VIVVDTSVLIGFFRGHSSPAITRLESLIEQGVPIAIPGICCQEILQGAKNEKEWRLLDEYLGSQDLLFPSDPRTTHWEAARIYYDCRRKGLTIRSSIDCLIAQLVLESDAALLHDDGDYEDIQQVRPLKTLQV
jgi:predicted nucleic acid-binding protein